MLPRNMQSKILYMQSKILDFQNFYKNHPCRILSSTAEICQTYKICKLLRYYDESPTFLKDSACFMIAPTEKYDSP